MSDATSQPDSCKLRPHLLQRLRKLCTAPASRASRLEQFLVPLSADLCGNDARVQVWGYFSVKSGGGIHEFSDSQVSFHECGPLRSSITRAVYCFMPWKQRHT